MIVGVTGHRPHKLGLDSGPLRASILEAIADVLQEVGTTRGITGMALGADQLFARVCLDLSIPFVAAVPFQGQASRWPASSQRQYYELLGQAADVVYVSDPGYARWKMDARNQWIVDHCELLLAVFDGTAGGTANTVLYAYKVERAVRIINPRELTCRTTNAQQSHMKTDRGGIQKEP